MDQGTRQQMPFSPVREFETVLHANLGLPASHRLDYGIPLADYGLDSLTAVNIMGDLEDRFQITFPDERITHSMFSTAGSLWDALAELLPKWKTLPSAVVADVVAAEPLTGGMANDVWRLTLTDGSRLVLKGSSRAPADLFPLEVEGLRALGGTGGLRVPRVIEVSARHLLLESMESNLPGTNVFWEAAGRAVAALHSVSADRFGWDSDGWLGLLPQENGWLDGGHEFFAERRILRYVREPKVRQALDSADVAGLERICARLPQLVPPAPGALNHGDLWRGNIVATAAGEPAFIDPAVCWMWPESELSMMYCTAPPSEHFFGAYQEVSPLADGWRERMPLLHLREHLSVLAHFGAVGDHVEKIRAVIRTFS
ncbi:fructosamine kinase family protein [Streptomyces hainanensis]|uniref:Aminoglycoside phosphotransferase n=1 Tax=Streptomyces hainanensis TaxID=402648 RepID=A0A4R4TG22_9ACTN|nr:fructosamine kinase family protein [Streptomyces hainanensis]TDC76437.1 aminoglycoside phosphotransferase [Streptomyces hainanensis]